MNILAANGECILLTNGCTGCVTRKSDRDFTVDPRSSGVVAFALHSDMKSFYSKDELGADGMPLAGALQTDAVFSGDAALSIFDVRGLNGIGSGLRVLPQGKGSVWKLRSSSGRLSLELSGGCWDLHVYEGCEPDWSFHPLPFSNLPEADAACRHAFIRGLIDFLSGMRRSASGVPYHIPNTNGGYDADGIPDTFFQFIATYPYLSQHCRELWISHLDWLGAHMRPDGAIPWGGVNKDKPYYHIWMNERYGLFFDGNALWLEMIHRLWRYGIAPDMERVIRAAGFYLCYTTPDGLVAAESKKAGCEWADFLKDGWHSSLVNILAYRAFIVTARMLDAHGMHELSMRYEGHAAKLRETLNKPLQDGGLWNGDGYADWRDQDGKVHVHWRIDTHMLAVIFGVPYENQIDAIFDKIDNCYFKDEPSVPAPYVLGGSWSGPEDDMLEGRRSFGCGCTCWPGRCGAALAAALYRCGRKEQGDGIFGKLVKLVGENGSIYESYTESGDGTREKSYIEHSLSPLYAIALRDLR